MAELSWAMRGALVPRNERKRVLPDAHALPPALRSHVGLAIGCAEVYLDSGAGTTYPVTLVSNSALLRPPLPTPMHHANPQGRVGLEVDGVLLRAGAAAVRRGSGRQVAAAAAPGGARAAAAVHRGHAGHAGGGLQFEAGPAVCPAWSALWKT